MVCEFFDLWVKKWATFWLKKFHIGNLVLIILCHVLLHYFFFPNYFLCHLLLHYFFFIIIFKWDIIYLLFSYCIDIFFLICFFWYIVIFYNIVIFFIILLLLYYIISKSFVGDILFLLRHVVFLQWALWFLAFIMMLTIATKP